MQSLDLRQVGRALPETPLKVSQPSASAGATSHLHNPPECFAPLLRHVNSDRPHHRRQRTTLHAVAATIPADAAALSGSAAATVYLGALVSALQRYIATTSPVCLSDSRTHPFSHDVRHSKKQISRQRLEENRLENEVVSLSVSTLIAPDAVGSTQDVSMGDIDEAGTIAGAARVKDAGSESNEHSHQTVGIVAAFVSLIGLSIQGCSHAVINLKAGDILQAVLAAYIHVTGHASVAHHSNVVSASTLSVLLPSTWGNPIVQTAFLYLLRHTYDSDEAFRLNSKKILAALMHCPRSSVVAKKASTPASTFFISRMKAFALGLQEDTVIQKRQKLLIDYRHFLSCLSEYSEFLLPTDAINTSKEILSLAFRDDDISSYSYSALGELLSKRKANAGDNEHDTCGTRPLIAFNELTKLVLTVLNHKLPDDSGDELVVSYTTCVARGTTTVVEYSELVPPHDDFIYKPVRRLFEAIDPSRGSSVITSGISRGFRGFLENRWFVSKPMVLTVLAAFVELKYRPVWSDVIPILRRYLENGMCAGNNLMNSGVRLLVTKAVSIREKAVVGRDQKVREVMESVLKSICRGGGVSLVLAKCGLKYDKISHVTNAWVLGVLRDNVAGGALSIFSKELLPLAKHLGIACKQKQAEKRVVEAKNIEMYRMQIWALLPGFCTRPSDLLQEGAMTSAFQMIYTCFSPAERESLFLYGASGLQKLSRSVMALSQNDPTSRKCEEAFSSRLKKLMPILIDGLSAASDAMRSVGLEAVTVACKATNDAAVVSSLLKKYIKELLELQLQMSSNAQEVNVGSSGFSASAEKRQHTIADILIAIAESDMLSPGAAEIGYLEKVMVPFFMEKKETVLQKKAYRVTSKLVWSKFSTRNKEDMMGFVKSVADARGMVAAGAKASRLSWITAAVNHCVSLSEEERGEYLTNINQLFLPEVMLSTRDVSEKCRSSAYSALVSLARAFYNLKHGKNTEGLQKFVMSVASGFGGKSEAMLAGTLSCIGRILQTFRYEIEEDEKLRSIMDSLFASQVDGHQDMNDSDEERKVVVPGPVAILLKHSSIEVQRAGVALVKVVTKCCCVPEGRLIVLATGLLPGLLHAAAGSNKREARMKVRLVLERLMRKCGLEALEAIFPEEHKKLLTAVRKEYAKSLAKKEAARTRRATLKEDVDRGKDKNRSAGAETMKDDASDGSDVERELLHGEVADVDGEGNDSDSDDGEVVDLLESREGLVTRRDAMDPTKGLPKTKHKKQNEDSDIKYSEDGKPIFVESDDSDGAEAGSVATDEDSDDDASDEGDVGNRGGNSSLRKRKLTSGGSESMERTQKRLKGAFGEEYRGKRGLGDVKRKGKQDPYAYVPLGPALFAPGVRPGATSKRSRQSAFGVLAASGSSRAIRAQRRKSRGGRSGVPGKR